MIVDSFLFQTGAIKSKVAIRQHFNDLVEFLFQTGAIKSPCAGFGPKISLMFLFQTGAIKSQINSYTEFFLRKFLFQTGAIKRVDSETMIWDPEFLFQTGAIKSLSKTDVYIILNPYGTCQVNFAFSCF